MKEENSFFEILLRRLPGARDFILFVFPAVGFAAAYAFSYSLRLEFAIPSDAGAVFGIHERFIHSPRGVGDAGQTLAREIEHRSQLGMKVVGFVDDQRAAANENIDRRPLTYLQIAPEQAMNR